jgi:cytochrome c oxidase subunit 4
MARANESLTYEQHQDIESHVPTYMRVFFALLIFTILEYFYAMLAQSHFFALVLGLMALALTKAALVGLYFMHLKFEGRWVYAFLVPAGVLAVGMVLALMPDIGMRPESLPAGPGEEEFGAVVAPWEPGRTTPEPTECPRIRLS